MTNTTAVKNLTAAELSGMMHARQIVLVDVREPGEYNAERIEGAILHPLSRFDPGALPPGNLVFHCGSGKRSLTAIERCAAAGLPHAAHLQGGIAAWKQAGLPTTRG